MLETSVLGLGKDQGLITALGGAMTTSTYVSRIVVGLSFTYPFRHDSVPL